MYIKLLYWYNSAKYEAPRIFYTPNYYYLPKWAAPEKISLLQAVKIINHRIKHKNNDNLKPKELNIDTMIDNVKNKK